MSRIDWLLADLPNLKRKKKAAVIFYTAENVNLYWVTSQWYLILMLPKNLAHTNLIT